MTTQAKELPKVCRECGVEGIREDVYEAHKVAVCTDCAHELNLLCECGRPMFVVVANEGPTCRECLLASVPGFLGDVPLDDFDPDEEYEVVSIYGPFERHHLVVPPGQPEELTERLVKKLRQAYRVGDGLVAAKVQRETWQGLELLVEWAEEHPAKPYPASFGVFDEETVRELIG